jgi:hypothetical protein
MSMPGDRTGTRPVAIADGLGSEQCDANGATHTAFGNAVPSTSVDSVEDNYVRSISTYRAVEIVRSTMTELGSQMFGSDVDVKFRIYNGQCTAYLRENGEFERVDRSSRERSESKVSEEVNSTAIVQSDASSANLNRASDPVAAPPAVPGQKRKRPSSPLLVHDTSASEATASTSEQKMPTGNSTTGGSADSSSNDEADGLGEFTTSAQMLTVSIHALGRLVWSDYNQIANWTIVDQRQGRHASSNLMVNEAGHGNVGDEVYVREQVREAHKAMDDRIKASEQCAPILRKKKIQLSRITSAMAKEIFFFRNFGEFLACLCDAHALY